MNTMVSDTLDREGIYAGNLLTLPRTDGIIKLMNQASRAAAHAFDCPVDSLVDAHTHYDDAAFFTALQQARKHFCAQTSEIHEHLRSFLISAGCAPQSWCYGEPVLRAVTPTSHLIAAAAQAFTVHRDTWYANPTNQINIWIGLFDVEKTQSFGFHPEYFDQPIDNTSKDFDFDTFLAHSGFQSDTAKHTAYPKPLHPPPQTHAQRFELKAQHPLAFSGAHLHRTMPNLSQYTRWSIDFRLVHLDDLAHGRGPENVDNRSTGQAHQQYQVFSPQ